MKNQFTLAFVFVILFAMILLYSRDKDNGDWNRRVAHYQSVSDSLQELVTDIQINVKQKDSIMLLYMSSLDKTLEELNKEARKNSAVITTNAMLQDSLISTYCHDMANLQQRPDVCK